MVGGEGIACRFLAYTGTILVDELYTILELHTKPLCIGWMLCVVHACYPDQSLPIGLVYKLPLFSFLCCMPDEARDGWNVALKWQLEVKSHLLACLIIQNNHPTRFKTAYKATKHWADSSLNSSIFVSCRCRCNWVWLFHGIIFLNLGKVREVANFLHNEDPKTVEYALRTSTKQRYALFTLLVFMTHSVMYYH